MHGVHGVRIHHRPVLGQHPGHRTACGTGVVVTCHGAGPWLTMIAGRATGRGR
jgi:hypothetical protein